MRRKDEATVQLPEDMTQPGELDDDTFARLCEYLDLERRKIFSKLSRAEQLFVLHQIWRDERG
jgi:hypothetical protein